MASLLDVLKRMRLVTALVAGMEHSVKGLRRAELQGSALFAAEQHAQLEEPASAAGVGSLSGMWLVGCLVMKAGPICIRHAHRKLA